MQRDLTDITVIMDRSGSMSSIKDDAEGGLNNFIAEQKKQPGRAIFSLVEFDHEYNLTHNGVPIESVGQYRLSPRGNTALLDAVGRAINDTGKRLASIPEGDRPGLVVFVIITDGYENASKEFRRDQIKQMIEHQQSVYKWQFTYLGANQDAFAEAGGMGISARSTSNYTAHNSQEAFHAAAKNVVRMRSMSARGAEVVCSYSAEEQAAMVASKPSA